MHDIELNMDKITASVEQLKQSLVTQESDFAKMQSIVNDLQSGNTLLDYVEREHFLHQLDIRMKESMILIDLLKKAIAIKELGV
jgi:hypothetical protein